MHRRCRSSNCCSHARRPPRSRTSTASTAADLREERGPKAVLLEQAVEAGAEGARLWVDGAIVLTPVHVVEMHPARGCRAAGGDAVMNLITADSLAHGATAALARDFVG